MKHNLLTLALAILPAISYTQELQPVKLLQPDKTRGKTIMEALSSRASTREWSTKELSQQDLSDLVWAANGVNRENGKRTAPSAMNAQDIDVYVFMQQGVYLYDAVNHILNPVVSGDHRDLAGKTDAPVTLVLISDISRFRAGMADSLKIGWAGMDAGIVSENISLFCAGTGLKTRPRASFPGAAEIRKLLNLKPTQYILLNHPVGY